MVYIMGGNGETLSINFVDSFVAQFPAIVAGRRTSDIAMQLANFLKPGSVKKINNTTMAFKCMENIGAFLQVAAGCGVPSTELFQTVDLWERQNLNMVVICLQSLGRKIMAKYDEYLASECLEWVKCVTNENFSTSGDPENFHAVLKDGQVLCRLANFLKPGSVKKINNTTMAFKCMENIGAFLQVAAGCGVPSTELFQTVDLWERQNLNMVVICLQSLGRKIMAKYDEYLASECLEWVKCVTNENFSTSGDPENFHAVLKDGQVLCSPGRTFSGDQRPKEGGLRSTNEVIKDSVHEIAYAPTPSRKK
ncbi:unnamed protein product [Notodromas monacha]|uniref:Calponin-homology (CH) domain-containing protein n=1 Tax=Notodromas monacha TaxID=399045 RepID=A0A7R9GC42_9CRUS|nr:unnamed protein product [Notodromas monacha]CAG0917208.1 unnamed protein product [Notodromas monacha]